MSNSRGSLLHRAVQVKNWLLFCWKQCDVQSQKVSKIAPNGWLETGDRVQTGNKLQLVPRCKLVPLYSCGPPLGTSLHAGTSF